MGYSLAQEARVTVKIILAVFEIMTLSVQMTLLGDDVKLRALLNPSFLS